jgi:hypothetical protein
MTGDSLADPMVCDGPMAAYCFVRRRFGLANVNVAKRKRLGIAGHDADGLAVDVYEHGGKRIFVSIYGETMRALAVAEKARLMSRIAELRATGLDDDTVLQTLAKEKGFSGMRQSTSLPDGVVAGSTRDD